MSLKKCRIVALAYAAVAWFVPGESAFALNYYGRATAGALLSMETFSDPNDPISSNDATVLSSRLFAKATEIAGRGLEATLDLRDKNDFFEKLDQERLQLTSANNFQVYLLNIHRPSEQGGFYGTVGRFAIPEAGARFADGVESGYRWNTAWRTSIFGGLNPKREDQTYLAYNSDARIFGSYTTFQPNLLTNGRSAYGATALVGEAGPDQLDRFYWYNNVIYRWSGSNQVLGMVYLDFKPRLEIQTALLSAHQEFLSRWALSANLTAIDVIEYTRRRGYFEELPSSPYREGSLGLRREIAPALFLDSNLSYGVRTADSYTRAELSAGPTFQKLLNQHLSCKGLLGVRRDFVSNDLFVRAGASYFSRNWEADLTLNYALIVQSGTGALHQNNEELGMSYVFSRAFVGSFSLGNAWDEKVTIRNGSFRLTYQFGQKAVVQFPEAAPPPAIAGGRY